MISRGFVGDQDGCTAIMLAVRGGHTDALDALLGVPHIMGSGLLDIRSDGDGPIKTHTALMLAAQASGGGSSSSTGQARL